MANLSEYWPDSNLYRTLPLKPFHLAQNYGVLIPVSGGGQLTLVGRLDNAVRHVGLSSSAEQGPFVANGGLGLVRLVALTPQSLCYWQLKMSANVRNWTQMHLHQGGPSK